MNPKQKTFLLILSVSVALTTASHASGAPTSQFGFSGWPYRQETNCTKPTVSSDNTQESIAKPTPTVPSVQCPTQAPVVTQCPDVTVPPEATATPLTTEAPTHTQEPEATKAPAATATPSIAPTVSPVVTPCPTATQKPTATPTATKAPEETQKPIETTSPPSTDGDYTTGSVTAQEENAFLLLNADRAANGRSALTLDPALCTLVRLKSSDMNANHYFSHTSPTYGSAADMLRSHGYSFTSVGENIAHHATVDKAQAAFMSSTGHRTNILGAQWTKVGIGVAYDSQGFVYVTQLFVR
ncbi:MAG: CAP domain-containing protein [Eubacteriales bacterium]|nr:CAP domain-containing protein [Eubacteriales bacterium]